MDDRQAIRRRLDGDDIAAITAALVAAFSRDATTAGVCVVDGCGVSIGVRAGHLVVEDGLGRHRRSRRFNRATSELRRLVVMADSGYLTLDALAWCRSAGVAVVALDAHRGELLLSTVTAGVNDSRLRRHQALAAGTEVGSRIVAELLRAKLAGEASVVGDLFGDTDAAWTLAGMWETLDDLAGLADVDGLMQLEASAAAVYFGAWTGRPETVVRFALRDQARLPAHWSEPFSGRRSTLGGLGARRAVTPLNALLNYSFALAVAECRLAALIVGLDPGLGLLHADVRGKDTLPFDLVEPIRPQVERFVLELIAGRVFHRADFLEAPDGSVRLGPALRADLTAMLPRWAEAAAPVAEQVAHAVADASDRPIPKSTSATSRKRRAAARVSVASRPAPSKLRRARHEPALPIQYRCKGCGADLDHHQRTWCSACWPDHRAGAGLAGSAKARELIDDAGARQARGQSISAGRVAAREARARALGWDPGDWSRVILPGLRAAGVRAAQLLEVTGLSLPSAYKSLEGRQVPDPRHWSAAAGLAGVAKPDPPRPASRGQVR